MNEARVEEQSHKSEMRAALQGDFERLRARRRSGPGEAVSEMSEAALQGVEAPVSAHSSPKPEPARFSWLDRLRGLR